MAVRELRIKRGLDLPITGEPQQTLQSAPPVRRVAVLGPDYFGLKPTMAVKVGDRVRLGQLLFTDKKNRGVRFTSPAAGSVVEVNRGAKRALLSVVVEIEGNDEVTFEATANVGVDRLSEQQIRDTLIESGLWTALRTRPFGKIPSVDSTPLALFITATDTGPLAPRPGVFIERHKSDFETGVRILAKLTDGKTFLCKSTDIQLSAELATADRIEIVDVSGPHPAGLVGTHIHFLSPVGKNRTVWHLGYQDVVAVGRLFTTGKLLVERAVSVAGPGVVEPCVLETRLGAAVDELVEGRLSDAECRVISGSVFTGRQATGPMAFLGRYDRQVSVLVEGRKRAFLGWLTLGFDKFSVKPSFLSALTPGKRFPFTTALEGSPRAMVPIGSYEKVMPLDIEPTFLLRALIVGDTDQAQDLGCLELEEEDLGLCSYVCPGKYDYGPLLRKSLTTIERDG